MRLLSNYDNYINELKLTESLRTFPLFLSKRLRKMLGEIDHDISKELLAKHSDLDTRVKQTFVDIHPQKSDTITFINPNKAVDVLGWDIKDDEELKDLEKNYDVDKLKRLQDRNRLFKDFRGETRWGRFINGAFPEQFKLSIPGGQNKQDIESFVNLYKSLYSREGKFKLLDIVNGDDIAYWYNYNHYSSQNGSLGDSCMKRRGSDTFELYTDNPEKVNMVIMYEDERKETIKARAILWSLNFPSDRKFMDRVYSNDYSDEQTFIDFAKENNWLYKSRQSMGSDVNITDPFNDNSSHKTMMSELHHDDYEQYPYCDTMTFYNPGTGEISNKSSAYNARYELTDTDGGRYTTSDYEEEPNYIYSRYHGEDIDENDAKYCKFGDDYVRSDEAIRVWNSGGDENYAVPGNPDIARSQFRYVTDDGEKDYDKWFPKNKCVWSDYLNTWVFKWSVVPVWLDLNRKEKAIFHKKQKNLKFKEFDGENWHIDLTENDRLIGEITPNVKRPVGDAPRGWHRRAEFIDDDGNIFNMGVFQGKQE